MHLYAYSQVDLEVGMDESNITPPSDYTHYRVSKSEGVLDSLYVKSIVIKNNDTYTAFVVCDLLWVERALSIAVREKISDQTDIPFGNIIISATHSHTTPAYHPNIIELNGSSLEPRKEFVIENDNYLLFLVNQISQSVMNAFSSASPAYMAVMQNDIAGLSFNRRFLMNDGRVVMNPGVKNKKILHTEGPIDPELQSVFFYRKSDEKPLGALSVYSLHADTKGGNKFSADFPGHISAGLKKKYGRKFVSVFAPAPSGNINHTDVSGTKKWTSEGIAAELVSFIGNNSLLTKSKAGNMFFQSSYSYPKLQELSREESIMEDDSKEESSFLDSQFLGRRRKLKNKSLLRMYKEEAVQPTTKSEGWHIPLEIQVCALNDELVIVALPGELFAEFGLFLKKNSPFKHTLVMELCQIHIAYVPTEEAFKRGGYEVINSRLAPGEAEKFMEKTKNIINKLHTDNYAGN